MSTPTNIRGRDFVRIGIAKALVGGGKGVEIFANARYGAVDGARIAKAAVAALTSSDVGTEPARTFIAGVVEKAVLGLMRGRPMTPLNTRVRGLSQGARGHFILEAAPIPLSKQSVDGFVLSPLKVAALVVTTKEALSSLDPLAESGLQQDLQNACRAALDVAFLDPSNSGTPNLIPASVTHGAPTIVATSDPVADLKALIAAFKGDISAAVAVTDAETAVALAMVQTATGAFLHPDCGARGGSLVGIPLLVTADSPRDSTGGQLALIDPTGIAWNVDDVQLDVATATSLDMSDSPSGPSEQVSLFQTNSAAWRVIIHANWENQRTGGVAVLTGIV